MTITEFQNLIGEIARPLAIIFTSLAASAATIMVATRTEDGNDGAFLVAAIFAGVGALYIGKAVEVARVARSEADVKIAESTGETKK